MATANIFNDCLSEDEVHNKLMTSFCCDYFGADSWENKFEKFKLKSFLYLKTPVSRCVAKPYDIWEELERIGQLDLGNYTVLKELVEDIDDELTYLIGDAEEKVSLLRGEKAYEEVEEMDGEDTELLSALLGIEDEENPANFPTEDREDPPIPTPVADDANASSSPHPKQTTRFADLEDDDLDDILVQSMSKETMKTTKYGVSLFKKNDGNEKKVKSRHKLERADDIESIILHQKPILDTNKYQAKDEDIKLNILRKKLYEINQKETQKIPISPLQKTSRMAMENIFAPVSIREDLEYRGKGTNIGMQERRTKPVERPDDMFYIEGESARNVFMLGQAAIGKSVVCLRLVENWCKANNPNSNQNSVAESSNVWVKDLSKYVYLFFVQLRHVFKSRTSIIDMICKDVFQHHPECHDVIRHVISSEKYQCLLVIDGLDEWKISDKAKKNLKIAGLPNTENMAGCTFLWSLRPWIMDRFSEILRGNDRVVEIHGLTADSISTVIEKLLVNVYELDKESLQYKDTFEKIKRKSQDAKMKSIMKIPLMAIACTQIWYEEKDVGNSMTSLYVALLDLLIRRSNKKSPLSSRTENKLFQDSSRLSRLSPILAQTKSIKEITPAILKLGKIAYEDIMADDTHLVFRVEELESSLEVYELNVALETGLLSKCEAPGSCNEENVSLNFFHKSIQEFLAAIYIESCGKMSEFYQHLTNVEVVLEHGNILLFLLGLNPNLASRISRHIVQITHSDAEICRYRTHTDYVLSRNSKVELLYKLQMRCIIEISYAETLSSCYTRRTKRVSSRLNLCCTSAKEDVVPFDISDVFLEDKDNEQTRITVDIITNSNADIRSLLLFNVSTDTEIGIPDSLLIQFLDKTKSLQSLDISGGQTDRTLFKISDRFSSLTALTLYNITIPPDAIRTCKPY